MLLPTSPLRLQQRAGFWSVPIIATRVGLICTTRSSGTVPPDEAHSPQKKDTRKYEQQAPQLRHGLASDIGIIDKKVGKGVLREGSPFYLCHGHWEEGRTHIFLSGTSRNVGPNYVLLALRIITDNRGSPDYVADI